MNENQCKIEKKPICYGDPELPDWGCSFYVEMTGYCALGNCEFLNEDGFCTNGKAVSEAYDKEKSE